MNQEQKQRSLYRRVMTMFIVLVLLLTFFSKSFYNYRLPLVSAESPKRGELDFKVESAGEVFYNDITSYYADKEGIVKAVYVKTGDKVKKGQKLLQITSLGTEKTEAVRAEKDGIIASLETEKGMYVSYMSNEVLYTIAEENRRWSVVLQLTEGETKNMEKGNRATVNLPGQNGPLEGAVAEIVPYTSESFSGYHVDVCFDCGDDAIVGEKADISIKKGNEVYDTLIPVSALRKDNKGYYVLTLEKDGGILGDGYKAGRNSVDLLDSDEMYCAVEGIQEEAYVIVASAKEIAEGDHVYYEPGEEKEEKR